MSFTFEVNFMWVKISFRKFLHITQIKYFHWSTSTHLTCIYEYTKY